MLGDNDAVLGFFLWLLDSTLQMERNCRTQKCECSRHEQKQKAPIVGLLGRQQTFWLTKTSLPNVFKSQEIGKQYILDFSFDLEPKCQRNPAWYIWNTHLSTLIELEVQFKVE